MDDRILTNEYVYPFRMACLKRTDSLATGKIVRTNFDASSTQVCFKKRNHRPQHNQKKGRRLPQEYQDFTSETELNCVS